MLNDDELLRTIDEESYINPYEKDLRELKKAIFEKSKSPSDVVLNTFDLLEKMADHISRLQRDISKVKHARTE